MKNIITANLNQDVSLKNDRRKRMSKEKLETFLKAQIENSLKFGWKAEDLICVTNFEFKHEGVSAKVFVPNSRCLTGSKTFAIRWLFSSGQIPEDEVVWAHDLDAWQNASFNVPEFKSIGICQYSNPKFNGGSVFYRRNSFTERFLVAACDEIIAQERDREEPVLNILLKRQEYADRATILNSTFNLGCSGFVPRFSRSELPIKVCHFSPTNRISWDTFYRDRNKMCAVVLGDSLVETLLKWFGDTIKQFKYGTDSRGYAGDWERVANV